MGTPTPSLGSLFQRMTTLSMNKFLLISNIKLSWHNLVTSSCPVACYLGDKPKPDLAAASIQGFVQSPKVSPEHPLLQAKEPQLPRLLIGLILQPLPQLCW